MTDIAQLVIATCMSILFGVLVLWLVTTIGITSPISLIITLTACLAFAINL